MDIVLLYGGVERLSKKGRGTLSRLAEHYYQLLRSRVQWVGFAGQSFFFNPYLAAVDMFLVHPGAAHGAVSRCFANFWAAIGTCGIYSKGRDKFFKRLGLLAPNSAGACTAAVVADTAYGFLLNLPGFMLNYFLSGCGLWSAIFLGFKAAALASWTSSISGGLFDSFNALDSDDAGVKARAPGWVRWLVIDRFELPARKKLIWAALIFSVITTAAIYSFGPGGLLR